MEDHQGQGPNNSPSQQQGSEKSEPVRSRWTPKPEQILILESIFNSGMVNPPKDETVRIRKLLEKFGAVGDANVFYWFQNRRSRSRRRQRQMQANLEQRSQLQAQVGGGGCGGGGGGANPCNQLTSVAAAMGFGSSGSSSFTGSSSSPSYLSSSSSSSSSSSCGVGCGQQGFGGFFSSSPFSSQMGFLPPEADHTSAASSALYPSDAAHLNYQSGFGGTNISGVITVFINGVATEVPRGSIDIKNVFGEDVMLVHSSGVSVPTNEFGFLMQSLQHGQSYFLVRSN
ncbi:hypothetical protein RIF29_19647 [Crotalaria pallida]|uniref:Homeobox domain-containing protein n=1 Tax=Crotalaria pallida TaxID=3830 RepID=A0AAN9F454_CROPI